ncbi:MAG: dockerin type I repeat-containing protein, partial [Candidatus Altiarchaeota archaeon]|nr:dockerin type I repeat-containing protein [Candidatus Altiarchaeota archaeon]
METTETSVRLILASVLVMFVLAQVPFTLGAQWESSGFAPRISGNHTIVIRAAYGNITGTHTLTLTVWNMARNSKLLTVTPIFPMEQEPPITLRYKIEVDKKPIDALLGSNVTIFFLYGGSPALFANAPALTKAGDVYETSADVPFRGDYQAIVKLEALKDDTIHNGTFLFEFFSPSPSPDLYMDAFLRERILTPTERFSVYANLSFHGRNIGGMSIYKANLADEQYSLAWDALQEIYHVAMRAPEVEGIFEIALYALDQGYVEIERVYVADTDLKKSQQCPITETDSGCDNAEEVRRCVDDYKRGRAFYTQDQLIQCFESGMGIVPTAFCGENMDLDGDEHLDDDDLTILQAIMELDEEQRAEYVSCADYDNSGYVDEADADCLAKVLQNNGEESGWYGTLDGGYCIDLNLDSPLAGDFNADKIISEEDAAVMDTLVIAAEVVEPPQTYLDAADFNQDGLIDEKDKKCQDYFLGLTLDNPAGYAPGNRIPASCLKIYHLDRCKGIRGDLNGDTKINELDLILIMLVRKGFADGDDLDMACADVNVDTKLTEADELCIQAYISGETDYYYACLQCDENLPAGYRHPTEICNDGWDNDCDGLVDKTSDDPASDMCQCTAATRCDLMEDADGGSSPGVNDGAVRVCRDLSWDSVGPVWVDEASLVCAQDKACGWYECEGIRKTCSNDGGGPKWFQALPKETDEKPLCQDGWDNDCNGRDEPCKEEEDNTMMYLMLAMMGM